MTTSNTIPNGTGSQNAGHNTVNLGIRFEGTEQELSARLSGLGYFQQGVRNAMRTARLSRGWIGSRAILVDGWIHAKNIEAIARATSTGASK